VGRDAIESALPSVLMFELSRSAWPACPGPGR